MRGGTAAGGSREAAADERPAGRLPIALSAILVWIVMLGGSQDVGAQAAADEEYVEPLVNQALENEKTGVELPWSNPATGSSGMIVIERTFYRDPRTPCRDYRRTLERAGGPTLEIQGTGCRVGPSRWTRDEEEPTSLAATPAPVTGRTPAAEEPPGPEPAPAEAGPPSCPTMTVTPVPCARPPAVVDYTMPTRTKL